MSKMDDNILYTNMQQLNNYSPGIVMSWNKWNQVLKTTFGIISKFSDQPRRHITLHHCTLQIMIQCRMVSWLHFQSLRKSFWPISLAFYKDKDRAVLQIKVGQSVHLLTLVILVICQLFVDEKQNKQRPNAFHVKHLIKKIIINKLYIYIYK